MHFSESATIVGGGGHGLKQYGKQISGTSGVGGGIKDGGGISGGGGGGGGPHTSESQAAAKLCASLIG